eukprot:Platyproteum_vivax@DN3755_c0_g1_i1.p1
MVKKNIEDSDSDSSVEGSYKNPKPWSFRPRNGRWKRFERELFIEAYLLYQNDWKEVAKVMRSRTATQCKSYHQKAVMSAKGKIYDNNLLLPKGWDKKRGIIRNQNTRSNKKNQPRKVQEPAWLTERRKDPLYELCVGIPIEENGVLFHF